MSSGGFRRAIPALALAGCAARAHAETDPTQERTDRFLARASSVDRAISTVEANGGWNVSANTSAAHDASAEPAGKARAAFTGAALIKEALALLLEEQGLPDRRGVSAAA